MRSTSAGSLRYPGSINGRSKGLSDTIATRPVLRGRVGKPEIVKPMPVGRTHLGRTEADVKRDHQKFDVRCFNAPGLISETRRIQNDWSLAVRALLQTDVGR